MYLSIYTAGRLGVDKIKTYVRETGCQDVYWVEPVASSELGDEHFYFIFVSCGIVQHSYNYILLYILYII
jgi:hypothetical protein